MEREIKFRAWDEQTKEMKYAFPSEIGNAGASRILAFFTNVMQYTGLKDKKGKEIYEGDIIIVNGHLWEVYFGTNERDGHSTFGWCCKSENHKTYHFDYSIAKGEIIGNIYESPELLTTNNEQR